MTADEARSWRVALIDPGDFSPAYDLALAEGLREAGADVVLIGKAGFDEGPRPDYRREWFYRPLAHPAARRLPGPVGRLAKGVVHGFDMLGLVRQLRDDPVDILHFQWMPLPLLDQWLLGAFTKLAPTVLTVHDSEPYNGAASLLMRLGHRRVLERFDALIVHTGRARERLIADGFATERVHLVPHGLLHSSTYVASSREVRAPIRLLQFGKIKPYKGVDVLLEALGSLDAATRAMLRVEIVGKPYVDPAGLRQTVSRLGLEETVQFRLDFIPDEEIAGLFASADGMLFPYRSIDASGVAMTAVAHGLPMVASTVGIFEDLLSDGQAGILVPPGDVTALAAALRGLAQDPGRLAKLASGMRAKRDTMPSWQAIGYTTTKVYHAARTHWRAQRRLGGISSDTSAARP